jgi:hypothetical protein
MKMRIAILLECSCVLICMTVNNNAYAGEHVPGISVGASWDKTGATKQNGRIGGTTAGTFDRTSQGGRTTGSTRQNANVNGFSAMGFHVAK